jgi:adenylate kinase family enzyme
MRLVLLGAPGSGKGTQAARLKDHLQVPHISTGDLLRAEVAAGSKLGLEAKEVMARGELVSDAILLGMLEDRFSRPDTKGGFILDGYPRNLAQADAMGKLLTRITVVGAAYLTLVCLVPEFIVKQLGTQFYLGGTSLLIVVNVTIDTVTQIQSHLIAHQYGDLIKKARLKGGRAR